MVAFIVGAALTLLFRAMFGEDVTAPEQLSSNLSALGKVAAAVLAIVVAPITEEFFFRGMLFRSVRDRWGFWVGAVSSSLLFGLVHYVAAPWRDALLLQTMMVVTGLGLALDLRTARHASSPTSAPTWPSTRSGSLLILAAALRFPRAPYAGARRGGARRADVPHRPLVPGR